MKKKTTSKSEPKTKSAPKSKSAAKKPAPQENNHNFLVVGLGASAGGVRALQEFFSTMPPNSGMAFVVILHLSPQYESNLAQIIQTKTTMPVIQVNETHKVEPNHVYVIPPTQNLEMSDGVINCSKRSKSRGNRVAIDIFFRSLAEAYGKNAVCVVLSGTGADGTLGLKRVKESNGFAIVQDPQDAEYDSMPQSAIATQLADWILPVRQMPERLIYFRDSSERLRLTDGDDGEIARGINADGSLREIITLLKIRTGHDFSNYKAPTLVRRIARHIQIHALEDIPSYLAFLREKPNEIHSLLKNLLINVTNFFRDKTAWEIIERKVVPNLFDGKKSAHTVRVWSVGCASGEEAYSIAMLLSEAAYKLPDAPQIQVFATDVDEDAIAEAREGRYPESIEADVSPERLEKFFVKESNYYRIKKELRETVLFSPHNVLRDPPFSRLDLIICRNLLIYLNRPTQERVLEIFHFALAANGFLFLGSSESAQNLPAFFTSVDKKNRIYSRRPHLSSQLIPPQMPVAGKWQFVPPEAKLERRRAQAFSLGEMHYKLLEKFAPPSILVNSDFEILYMGEHAGRYLRFKGGEPSNNILKLINPDLLPDLRAALFTAQRERKSFEFHNIHFQIDGKDALVDVLVRAVDTEEKTGELLLIIFREINAGRLDAAGDGAKKSALSPKKDATETVVRRLEDDLLRTKEQLRATIEQHEVSMEELKASNEELQAINEELRSASEELETSKEELQSVNEELTTVNQELKTKIDETIRVNSDLQNLIASTDIATIFLDRNLRISRFTPLAESLFNITPADIGRPLGHFTHRLKYENLSKEVAAVLRSLVTVEHEISDKNNRYYIARFVPYRTIDDRIEGVVLNFIDITERRRMEEALRKLQTHLGVALEAAGMGVWELDLKTGETQTNFRHNQIFGYESPVKKWSHKLFVREHLLPGEVEKFNQAFENALKTGEFDVQLRAHRKNGGIRWIYDRGRVIYDELNQPARMAGVTLDITERKEIEEKIREADSRMRMVIDSSTDYAIFTLDDENIIKSWNPGAEFIFGYSEREAIGKSGAILFTPEDRERGVPVKEIETARRKGRAEDERWHLRKDGTQFFASGMMMRMQNGEGGFVKICRDQTEKLKAQTVLQDKQMLAQLVSTQEDERRRIARDIHDHLGQQLTVLRLKLESLKKMCDDEKICDEIDETQKITARLDRDVDFLAWELRPAALDDLGLRSTLGNFVAEWARYTGIKAGFHVAGLARARLDFEIETNLYRIAQEALNNIYKHAKAKNVSVLLEKRRGMVLLIIEDDGIGFNPQNKLNRTKGIGLTGMRERAKICGGNLEIESVKGKGTTVFARVPAHLDKN